jgi:hypothetical protein
LILALDRFSHWQMANYRLRLLLYCGGRWPRTEPRLRCRPLTLGGVALPILPPEGADMAGDPSGCRQALAAVPQAAPGAGGLSWPTSPACWRAPDPSWNATGRRPLRAAPRGPVRPPPAADLYLLASVLHDWDDDHAARILAALGRSATSDTRLRIFEMLLPEDATPHRAKLSDVLMLLMFDGARERTVGQYRDLLEATGWRLERVVASPGPMSIIQASRPATG